jgi:hypothetical protein
LSSPCLAHLILFDFITLVIFGEGYKWWNSISSFWEANSHSAIQEIPRLSWNPKVHCLVHKSSPLAPILSHMNSVHKFPPF